MNIHRIENNIYKKTAVPGLFIKEYLPGLPAEAVKLYLYLIYASENDVKCDENSLAVILNCDASVVSENIIILESMGLIATDNNTVIIMDIVQKEIDKNYRPRVSARPDDFDSTHLEKKYALSQVQKAISDKFFSGQMTVAWYNEIESWLEKYAFEPEVVFMLFQHCSKKGAMTRPYISKVAESWGEKHHLRTAEQVDEYVKAYEDYRVFRNEILKKLKWRRNMNVYEEEIVEKWFYTYKYSMEIIELALKKSSAKNNPTLAMFDAIITSWYKNGLKAKCDIEKYEEERKKAFTKVKKQQNKDDAGQPPVPQMNNFTQRNYDEDYLNSFIFVAGEDDK